MKRLLLILPITAIVCAVSAQTISLHFPYFKGAEYDFSLFQGVVTDTVQQGVIGNDGKLTLTIPEKYKGYKGMAQWTLRSGGGLSFVVNGSDFSISCTEQAPNENNIIYKGNPDSDFNNRHQLAQRQLFGKIEVMRAAQGIYQTDTKSNIYRAVEDEMKVLKESFSLFQSETKESPLYAAHYQRINDFTKYFPLYSLSDTEAEHKAEMQRFVAEELNMESLYTSGLWKDAIQIAAGLYENGDGLMPVMIGKLQQTTSMKVFGQLADALVTISEQYGWNEQEEQLAYFLVNDGRITNPVGKLKQVMTLYKLAKGSKAPGLSHGKLPDSNTLLVFYESGCGNCDIQIQELKKNYALLQKKGYEVVTVSSDADNEIFAQTSAQFPWKLKYRDTEGFGGQDFENYGIIGTPTFFVLDKKGVIQGRYARLVETRLIENTD